MKKVFFWFPVFLLAALHASGATSFAGSTELISADSSGRPGDHDSGESAISADGNYVAFSSWAGNLAPGAAKGKKNIFLRDRKTGQTTLISKNSSGEAANGDSSTPSLSADGRFVAFTSLAGDLVPGAATGKGNIFIYDRKTGQTTLLQGAENGGASPALSADGRYVAFVSQTGTGPSDMMDAVFVQDRQTGETRLVSKSSAGNPANGPSNHPSISADGRNVAFVSFAGNLVPGTTDGGSNIFVHDRQTGETTLISRERSGKPGNDSSVDPAISANGRFVTFCSAAKNLVPGTTNDFQNIFVFDRQTDTMKIVSKAAGGKSADGSSTNPAISADGRFVAFASEAGNLVQKDTNGKADAFVHDMQTGKTTIISVNSAGAQGNDGGCFIPAISADGRYVAFESMASNLVKGDTNGKSDVFIHDRGGK